eukprot:CAMPEP_0203759528 /NCGR_PEP_ID=MMETSP0098-20131031/12567_1 /ASSEMBLY_ACC=CAM_ASM_000208 /TAXON_ID=96639 /ORGANISM=" , Strain NY0313808BC1" /LENGTH=1607 /DNA_ID=CAMNT_0050652537 /DNA_START=285 /DNA_END=5105 /DNA_ORIENTATION=+
MFCGEFPGDITDANGVTQCYRGLVFLGLPSLFALGGFCYGQVEEMKLRKKKTVLPRTLALTSLGVLDCVRVLIFLSIGLIPLVGYLVEHAHWSEETGGLAPFRVIDIFVFGIFVWIVLGVSWLFTEVRRGSKEWKWLRLFTLLSIIGESLRLWSDVGNLDTDYKDKDRSHRDFVLVMGISSLSLKVVASFAVVCFNRDWHRLRAVLREYGSANGLSARLLPEQSASFMQEEGEVGIDEDEILKRTPEQYAGLFSRLVYSWLSPLMKSGFQRPLERQDFYRILRVDEANLLGRTFSKAWKEIKVEAELNALNKELREGSGDNQVAPGDYTELTEETEGLPPMTKTKSSVWTIVKALHRAGVLTPFYQAAFFKLVYDTLTFVGPQLLKRLIKFLGSKTEQPSVGYTLVALMFGSAVLQTFVLHVYFHKCFRTGMRVRAALITAIYRKSLKLTPAAREQKTTGEVVNLMSTDCERLNSLFPYLHVTWSSPYQVILALCFLWVELKYAVLVSVLVIFLFMTPSTALVARRIKLIQRELMGVKDERIRVTGEVITSIKVIKMYGWERTFRNMVEKARTVELALLRRYVYMRAAARTLWSATPILVTLTTFAAFVALGGNLDPATAFTSLSLLNILRFPLAVLPNIFNSAIEASVSLRRIAEFLDSEEIDQLAVEAMEGESTEEGVAINVVNGTFYWDDELTAKALDNINMSVHVGETCVVTGEVGSGKTALLSMLIRELQPERVIPESRRRSSVGASPLVHRLTSVASPRLNISGSVAYAAQVPWIMNASVRDNITFGSPYDRQWYNEVVSTCSLISDFDLLPDGDRTEIGERGINLSGGQKARIALARAVYSRADILLLETIFEAVDEHVGSYLWTHCIQGILKKPNPTTGRPRTVVIVTHALKYVHEAEQVIVMKNGRIAENGPYDQIVSDPTSELARLSIRVQENAAEREKTEEGAVNVSAPRGLERKISSFRKPEGKKAGNLTGQEERSVGSVSGAVYTEYFKAVGGAFTCICVVLGYMTKTGLDVATSSWLAYWSSHSKKQAPHEDTLSSRFLLGSTLDENMMMLGAEDITYGANATGSEHSVGFYLGIYSVFSFSSLLFISLLTVFIATTSLVASKRLHQQLITNVCRAPMAFFDTTPIGRILNRFSKDIYCIDETLPDSINSLLTTAFNVLGTLMTICVVVPVFMGAIPFLAMGYYFVQKYYIASSRELKRWDSVLRSPIYSHFSESLDGVSTIRAYHVTRRFTLKNQSRLERQLEAYYLSIAANRWLAVRLEFIGSLLVLVTTLAVVMMKSERSAAFSALAVSYSLSITQSLNWSVRMLCDLETNVVSVERISEYTSLEQEAPEDSGKDVTISPEWPAKGEIVFDNVFARYRPGLENVLRGVKLQIKPGQKVGIVGRTGAGKSTLFLTLLRLMEIHDGKILIDGVDIKSIGLEKLRQSLAIIPQDPVMFNGTLRNNLDPTGKYSEEDIMRALEVSQLKTHIESMVESIEQSPLDISVKEGGANFSFGQRQLIAIARAILRGCKILLLDEATSGIDQASDTLIQETIRTEFSGITMLTVAHRLTTIMDSDKVIVMGAGRVMEDDSPEELLKNPNSEFSKLVKQMK